MISGLQTLRNLDQGLESVRADINRIDNELNRISETLHANRRAQAQSLKQLAEIRLNEIARGTLIGKLNAADERARNLLDERRQAYEQLEKDIANATTVLQRGENDRTTALETVHMRAQAIVDCEHKIQAELEVDSVFQEQLREARQLDSIADQAEVKARLAEQDRHDKGIPYENNRLFMYLWKRHYGTPDYKGGPLTRTLDDWVDGLSNYSKYRVNYWTLLEIPKRLQLHAEAARKSADQALKKLTSIEIARAARAGLPALQDDHAQAQKVLDAIDDDIAKKEDKLNQLLQRRTQFAEAKDSYMEQSLQTLSSTLNNQNIVELNDAAHQTTTDQDNQVVRELADLREQNDDLEEELKDHRRLHEAKLNRLQQLENVRRQFKNRRFDDVRSGFGNEDLITAMISQFLNGLINSGELWRVLERHQRHQDVGAWPDFGSGGLGLPGQRQKSPWHFPSGRDNNGGFRLPKSGGWRSRGGGGGFRTGGGF